MRSVGQTLFGRTTLSCWTILVTSSTEFSCSSRIASTGTIVEGGGGSTRLWRHVNSLTLYMYWLTVLFVDEDRLIKYPICWSKQGHWHWNIWTLYICTGQQYSYYCSTVLTCRSSPCCCCSLLSYPLFTCIQHHSWHGSRWGGLWVGCQGNERTEGVHPMPREN